MSDTREQLTLLDMIGVVVVGFAIVASIAIVSMVPTFTRMFEDFSASLPVATQLVIQRWPMVLTALVSTGLLLVGVLGLGIVNMVARRLIMLAAFCISSLTVVLTIVALYLPVFEMAAMIEAPTEPLSIDLPQTAAAMDISESIVISITADGSIYLDADPVDLETLRGRLLTQAGGNPDTRVVIAADSDARHAAVVEVMDVAKKCGLSRLGISISQAEPQPLP